MFAKVLSQKKSLLLGDEYILGQEQAARRPIGRLSQREVYMDIYIYIYICVYMGIQYQVILGQEQAAARRPIGCLSQRERAKWEFRNILAAGQQGGAIKPKVDQSSRPQPILLPLGILFPNKLISNPKKWMSESARGQNGNLETYWLLGSFG